MEEQKQIATAPGPIIRTKLISKELLTDEEILKIGIPEDEVQTFRMKKFKEAFTLDKWYSTEFNFVSLHYYALCLLILLKLIGSISMH